MNSIKYKSLVKIKVKYESWVKKKERRYKSKQRLIQLQCIVQLYKYNSKHILYIFIYTEEREKKRIKFEMLSFLSLNLNDM